MLKYEVGNESLAGHGCYVCGRADNLVSTEVSIVGEGILAICGGCAADATRMAGHRVDNGGHVDLIEALVAAQEDIIASLTVERDNALARIEQLGNEWVAAVERATSVSS